MPGGCVSPKKEYADPCLLSPRIVTSCQDNSPVKSGATEFRRIFRIRTGRFLVVLSITMTCVVTLLVILSLCVTCPMVASPLGASPGATANLGDDDKEGTPHNNNNQVNIIFQNGYLKRTSSSKNHVNNDDSNLAYLNNDDDSNYDSDVYGSRDYAMSPTKKLPQAIIIGVKKAGTRALLEFLRIHPDVRAPGPEPHFFDRHYNKGLEWYRNQMPTTLDGQMTMEKTPSYFITKEAPGRIRKMSPHVKLIVVVRNPVTRAISDYTQALSKRNDVKPFERLAFINNRTGLVDTSWGAIKIGVYAKHLEKWLKYFPLNQIHFVNGERLIVEPAKEVSKVQAFLGLKPVINEKHFYFNSTKGFPCLKKPEHSGNPHCLGRTKGRAHPIINPLALQRLTEFYRPFNQKFYQMVGQDFGWP